MPRIRTIKPEFWSDEKLAPMPVLERLVFLGLISMADDAGRVLDNVKAIDGFVFPETDDTARGALDALAAAGRILRYVSASGQKLIQLAHWERHQKVDHRAKYVLPAPASAQPREAGAPPDAPAGLSADEHATVARESREGRARMSRSDLRPTTIDQGPTTTDLRPATTDQGSATAAAAPAIAPPRLTLVERTASRSPAAPEERTAPATTPATPPAAPATAKSDLPPSARRVLTGPYGWTKGPGTERQQAVLAQLLAVLGDGVRYKGAQLRAVDRGHLEACCAEALAQPHRDPDTVINTVLLKLRDTYTEVLAARDAARDAAEAQAAARALAQADAWLTGAPDVLAALEATAAAEFPEFAQLPKTYREGVLRPLKLQAYAAHAAAAGAGDAVGVGKAAEPVAVGS